MIRNCPVRRTISAIFLFTTCLGVSQPTYAQRKDSLLRLVGAPDTHDTTTVLLLAAIAQEYRNVNADSMLYYAQKGAGIARNIGYERGSALCAELAGFAYMKNSSYEPAVATLNEAQRYFGRVGDQLHSSETAHVLGLTYYMQSMYAAALMYFNDALKAAERIGDNYRMGRAQFYIGSIHNDQGEFTAALKNYLAALKLYEQCGDQDGIGMTLTNIASLYAQLNDTAKALEYIDRSLKIKPGQGSNQSYLANRSNIAYTYSMLGYDSMALKTYKDGLHAADSLGDKYWKTIFIANLAEAYYAAGDNKNALVMYGLMLMGNEKLHDVNITASARLGMGRIMIQQGRTAEGMKHMLDAFGLVKQYGMKRLVMDVAHELSDAYEKTGDYKHAYEYNKIWHAYKDSIFNEDNSRKLHQLQYDAELEKKQLQIDRLSKTKEAQAAKAEKQNVIQLSLLIGMGMLITMIVLMYRGRRAQKQNNIELLERKEKIKAQAAKLEELNRFKDRIFSVLSHDLRGPMNSITTALKMFHREEISAEEYDLLKPEINKQLAALNLLLDNVLTWARDNIYDLKPAMPSVTDLHRIAEQNTTALTDAAVRKSITLTSSVAPGTTALCDDGQMNIVVRNLLANAIKFTPEGGAITLHSEVSGDRLLLSVTDTGVGMSAHQLENLFSPSIGRSTFGTDGEKGLGLGLLLCSEFVKANNGTIMAASTPGKGTTFTISLPRA